MSIRHTVRVLVVGCGKMGEAIVGGWLSEKVYDPSDFLVVTATSATGDRLSATYGLPCTTSLFDCPCAPEMVLLAVKPQVMDAVLQQLKKSVWFDEVGAETVFVSIAAGLSTDRLCKGLGKEVPVVRVMPNVALRVGAGASSVCAGAFASSSQLERICELFALLGDAVSVDESLMDATCALNGSGPAYVARLIEQLRDGAVEAGLEAKLAERLALQTVFGTAALMKETGQSAETTRLSVCSPGGTTLAAMAAMDEAGFDDAVKAAVAAAAARSKELASC